MKIANNHASVTDLSKSPRPLPSIINKCASVISAVQGSTEDYFRVYVTAIDETCAGLFFNLKYMEICLQL